MTATIIILVVRVIFYAVTVLFPYPEVIFGELGDLIPAEVEGLHVRKVLEDMPRHLSQRVVSQTEEVH